MSLKGFHVVFISASVLLALGLGAWCLRAQQRTGAAGAFAVAALLVAYEIWFLKKSRSLS